MKNKLLVIVVIIVFIFLGYLVYTSTLEEAGTITSDEVSQSSDIFLQQQALDDEIIEKEYNMYERTFEDPYILVNPYDTNTLSAYIMFDSNDEVKYSYTVEGKTESTDFTYVDDEYSDGTIQVPVFGLYANAENNVEVSIEDEDGNVTTETFVLDTTNEYYDPDVLTADVNVYDEEQYTEYMDGNFVYDNYGRFYDANGDLRGSGLTYEGWYGYVKVLNGRLIITDKLGPDSQYTTAYSVDPMGKYDQDFVLEAPEGQKFHHDATYANGYYYMLSSYISKEDDAKDYHEDSIAVYDEEGNFVEEIDMGDLGYVDVDGQVAANANPYDVHYNTIDYYEPTNSLILSSRSFSSITSLNLDTLEVEWVLDDPNTVSEEYSSYLLDIEDEESFDFTSGNHTAFVADEFISDAQENHMYISVMDNNSCISEDGSEQTKAFDEELPEDGCYSSGVSTALVYDIDLENNSVSLYNKIETPATSAFRSSVYLTEDTYQIYSATPSIFYVYDKDNNLIFEYEMPEENSASEDDPFTYRATIVTPETIGSLF